MDWVVVALGKLGGHELTIHSDLDLVVIYAGDPGDSPRFMAAQTFVQSMESFLEQPTSEGIAYRIDTRLRPEGRKGALAIPIRAFARYLDERAEIWERLAWTRARVLAGSPSLGSEVDALVERFVYGPWDARIPAYMRDVRARMERELAQEYGDSFDFKVGRGGLADIDFLLQMIQIKEGHERAAFRLRGTRHLLRQMPESALLPDEERKRLAWAYHFLRTLEAAVRMESDTNANTIPADPNRLHSIGLRFGLTPPGDRLLTRYGEITADVRAIFRAVVDRLGARPTA